MLQIHKKYSLLMRGIKTESFATFIFNVKPRLSTVFNDCNIITGDV